MEKVCDFNICTGCGLCSNICPKNAISMLEIGEHGHFKPYIDPARCVECHLCEKKCPALNESVFHGNLDTYAAWLTDDEKRKGSSSGGVAAALYETALGQGFHIVGTYLDDGFRARMELTDDPARVRAFQGSKYMQVIPGSVYSDAVRVLKNSGKVLFIGSPCQCAAMKTAAGTDQDRLITVELICHGTPAQKIFLEHAAMHENRSGAKISDVSFRSEKGVELTLSSGSRVIWQHTMREDEYLFAFNYGLLHNESCYTCPYARPDRAGDLTIGDFWKLGTKIPFQKPECRVSFLGVNTEKGREFLHTCQLLRLEKRDYQEALDGNPNLNHPSVKHPDYDRFWSAYREGGLKNAYAGTIGHAIRNLRIKRGIERKVKGAIKRMLRMK